MQQLHHSRWLSGCGACRGTRVESGSDDLDNLGHLGHLFGGSSGCHPQTKLSGCDLGIKCFLEKSETVLASGK